MLGSGARCYHVSSVWHYVIVLRPFLCSQWLPALPFTLEAGSRARVAGPSFHHVRLQFLLVRQRALMCSGPTPREPPRPQEVPYSAHHQPVVPRADDVLDDGDQVVQGNGETR